MDGETVRDLAWLEVPLVGALEETGDRWMPFRLADPSGAVVEPVSAFFADLLAAGRSEATVRSYGMDLLRWFRFVWAAGVPWNMATRAEARDFCRWMQVAGKPARPHWRAPDRFPGSAVAGTAYSPSVRAHSETVLRGFYEFHLEAGTGPIVNPFPLDRSRRGRRAHAHHNPMDTFRNERHGPGPPPHPATVPRRWMCCSGTARSDRRAGCRRSHGPAGRPGDGPRQVRAASGAAGLAGHRRQPPGGARAADRPAVHAGCGRQPGISRQGPEPAAVVAGGPARRQLARALAGERGRYCREPVAGAACRVAGRLRRVLRLAEQGPVRR